MFKGHRKRLRSLPDIPGNDRDDVGRGAVGHSRGNLLRLILEGDL